MKLVYDRFAARLLLSVALSLAAIGVQAATNTVANLSLATVQAAINSASAGDTVLLPAGSATWSSALNLNKPITLRGAGIGVTTITGGSGVINLNASSKSIVTRVTGLTINGNQSGEGIVIGLGGGLTEWGLFRVDHCRVIRCSNYYAIRVSNLAAGVIDHNRVEDSYLLFGALYGIYQDRSWQLPASIGTTNNVVLEDNVFLHTSGGYMPFAGSFENGQGCRMIFRYNTFTNLSGTSLTPCFDLHGNQSVVTANNTTSSVRGNRNCEWYKNIFVNSSGGSKFYYRGGVLMCYSNTWIGGGWDTGFRVNEEDGTSRWNYRNGYPGYDMHWLWSWNNTQNGSPMANSWYSALTPANDSVYLKNGVNIWYVPPSASAPGDPDYFMANLGFTAGRVTPAFTSYTQLVYPHPLVTAEGGGGTVVNQSPTARLAANQTSGVRPLTVNFSSSGSSDPEGTLLTYAWTFGDGRSSTSANPSNTYSNLGSYTAQLTVSDRTNTGTASVQITVIANSNGLVAAYGFDEGSGTAVSDASGNGNGGVVTSANWLPSGRFGKALTFGTGSFVSVPDASQLDATSAVTLEAWVYPTSTGTDWQNVILKGGPNTALSYILNAVGMPNLAPSFYINAAPAGVFSPAALPLNTWSHLCGTYDGSTMKIYRDGVLVASMAQTGAIAASSDGLYIGGNPYYGHNFNGSIDEVRIYNRALSLGEIQIDMNTPLLAQTNRPSPPGDLRLVAPGG